jgi:SAM-dependent methyltransferase
MRTVSAKLIHSRPGINIGCGACPTPGWLNLDNSPVCLLSKWPHVLRFLVQRNFFRRRGNFAEAILEHGIRHANAAAGIPAPNESTDLIYSCHMLDQLDERGRLRFLSEIHRVLRPGGHVRIVVMDLRRLAWRYMENMIDATAFVHDTGLAGTPASFVGRLQYLLLGKRSGHRWMFDQDSLVRLVSSAGFVDVVSLPPGETRIPNPGVLNLREREGQSVYIEARKPGLTLTTHTLDPVFSEIVEHSPGPSRRTR